jgi:hypothetical protein
MIPSPPSLWAAIWCLGCWIDHRNGHIPEAKAVSWTVGPFPPYTSGCRVRAKLRRLGRIARGSTPRPAAGFLVLTIFSSCFTSRGHGCIVSWTGFLIRQTPAGHLNYCSLPASAFGLKKTIIRCFSASSVLPDPTLVLTFCALDPLSRNVWRHFKSALALLEQRLLLAGKWSF